MSRGTIQAEGAPPALGPYCHAVLANGLIYTSGQIGLHPDGNDLIGPDIASQTRQTLENLRAILRAAGSDLDRVLKVNVYLADLADFPAMNEVYGAFFQKDPPARACVGAAALPKGARVEMDVVALIA